MLYLKVGEKISPKFTLKLWGYFIPPQQSAAEKPYIPNAPIWRCIPSTYRPEYLCNKAEIRLVHPWPDHSCKLLPVFHVRFPDLSVRLLMHAASGCCNTSAAEPEYCPTQERQLYGQHATQLFCEILSFLAYRIRKS